MSTNAPTTAHDLGVYYYAAIREGLRGNTDVEAHQKARTLAQAAKVGVTLDTVEIEARAAADHAAAEANRPAAQATLNRILGRA